MSSVADPGTVELSVPARTEYLQLLRLNVAGFAASSFGVDEVEDLKIAVEELAALLLRCEGGDRIDLRPTIDGGGFSATGRRQVSADAALELDDFLPTVLDAVVDGFDVARDGQDAVFRFEKRLRDD